MALSASVKSAIRVIEVFEYFEVVREPRSLKEIIDDLQYPQSSATVLLKNLVGLGYLSYDRQRRKYFPTRRLARLGDWVDESLFGEGRVLKMMDELHEATGDLIGLGVQNDVYLQYIRVLQSKHPVPYNVPEGRMRVLTQSAGGWMLLASQSMRRIDYTVRRANLAAQRPEDRVPVEDILARIPGIQKQGYAYAENIPFDGAATLCVPLPCSLKGQPAIIGISGTIGRMQPREKMLAELLISAAQSLDENFPEAAPPARAEKQASQPPPAKKVDVGEPRSWFDTLGDYDARGSRLPIPQEEQA